MAKTPDLTIKQFMALLQDQSSEKGSRLLGLDLGTKTIGLAISNSNWTIASPVYTIRRQKFTLDVEELLAYATKEKISGLVIGLPLNMDDSEGPRAQATRAFVRNMAKFTDLPVFFWDERLSSVVAEEQMFQASISKKKHSGQIDQRAAAIILQGCLDHLRQELEAFRDGSMH
ncbi:MAG: Holliday junction resolvase RuvX [Rhizobiaceae bacterium]